MSGHESVLMFVNKVWAFDKAGAKFALVRGLAKSNGYWRLLRLLKPRRFFVRGQGKQLLYERDQGC